MITSIKRRRHCNPSDPSLLTHCCGSAACLSRTVGTRSIRLFTSIWFIDYYNCTIWWSFFPFSFTVERSCNSKQQLLFQDLRAECSVCTQNVGWEVCLEHCLRGISAQGKECTHWWINIGQWGRRIEEGWGGMLSPKRIYSKKRKDCRLGSHIGKDRGRSLQRERGR